MRDGAVHVYETLTEENSPARFPAWAADLGLTAVTAIWGWSFVLVRDAVAVYPVFPFLAVRFALAALVVGFALAPRLRRLDRGTLAGGALMGTALFWGYAFQTSGLKWTSAAHSGIITGLFVVFTPLFEGLWRRRMPGGITWAAAAVSTGGMALLAGPLGPSGANVGDFLSLLCAMVYAVHLLVTSHQARHRDVSCLVVVQLAVVAIWAALFSVPSAGSLWPIPHPAGRAILLTALLATALAYFAQTAFQRHTTPTRTAFLFTLEPVFAALFAWLVGGETLGPTTILGGALIVAGMVLGQRASSG